VFGVNGIFTDHDGTAIGKEDRKDKEEDVLDKPLAASSVDA
jgi:hypothetical protein